MDTTQIGKKKKFAKNRGLEGEQMTIFNGQQDLLHLRPRSKCNTELKTGGLLSFKDIRQPLKNCSILVLLNRSVSSFSSSLPPASELSPTGVPLILAG